MRQTKITVDRGIVKVNKAFIIAKEKKLSALLIDLGSKYCEVIAHGDSDKEGCECIIIDGNKNSLYLDKKFKKPTTITFDEFKGWEIHSYTIWKWTVHVCFFKKRRK